MRKRNLLINVVIFITTLIFSLLGGELILYFFGIEPMYIGNAEIDNSVPARWWTCDSDSIVGCKFNRDYIPEYFSKVSFEFGSNDKRKNFSGRLKIINKDGYHDEDEFFSIDSRTNSNYRILFLGDSFTWGASADIGYSWVELLEKRLNKYEVITWNAAIPATGTRQALLTYNQLSPLLKPHLVILGFYINDFDDNLYPVDMYFRRIDGEAFLQYTLDRNLNPEKMTPSEAYFRAYGVKPANEVGHAQYLFFRTRVGTVISKGVRGGKQFLIQILRDNKTQDEYEQVVWEQKYTKTQNLLKLLNQQIIMDNSKFLVVLIPGRYDIQDAGREYLAAVDIFENLDIDFIDTRVHINSRYYNSLPDTHWNNLGHYQAAEVVEDTVYSLVEDFYKEQLRIKK